MAEGLSNLKKIIVIGGPTCSGKSDLGIYLAKKFNGEIVNADSMQVYKYFDIGTAKPKETIRKEVVHHLIDIVEPDEPFDAKRFVELADCAIESIIKKGKIPIVVGGTGLYIRALLYGLFEAKKDEQLRRKLQKAYEEDPNALFERLLEVDEQYARKIGPNDSRRIVRALEVYEVTGKRMSDWEKDHGFKSPRYNALFLGLRRDRKELYFRIKQRVEKMIEDGWIDEVKNILKKGFRDDIKPFLGIGYSEIIRYIKGEIPYSQMVKMITKKTKNYAKRQLLWFSSEKNVRWFLFPEEKEKIEREIKEFFGL